MEKDIFFKNQLKLLFEKENNNDVSWDDIVNFRKNYYGFSENKDTVRKGTKLLYEYLNNGWELVPSGDNNVINEIKKERIKLQTEKIEYNKYLRESARDELLFEHIVNAIHDLEKIKIPTEIKNNDFNNSEYLLCFGDMHYGKSFKINGINGTVLNEFSPKICEDKMWDLLFQVIEIVKVYNIKNLSIINTGDEIEGMLRVSQLMKLEYGIVDSTIMVSELLSQWLNELSKYVKIKYYMVSDSNHDELRLLGQPKYAFKNENMSKIIKLFLKERLRDNKNIDIIDNTSDVIFMNLCGYNIMSTHGEMKDMERALDELSRSYNIKINYLICGHKHHSQSEEIGKDVEVITIPSIVGIDDYSMSLRKTSSSGARLYKFAEGKGKVLEFCINLS